MQIRSHVRLNHWLKKAEGSPELEKIIDRAEGWANAMEKYFIPKGMAMEIDDLENDDPSGQGFDFLMDCWGFREGLRKQKTKNDHERQIATEEIRSHISKNT